MALYIRTKRVTDPLDERVRDRLRGVMTGYASSGSEHDGAVADDGHSCFSDLIHDFLEPRYTLDERDESGSGEDSDSDKGAALEKAAEQAKKLRELLDPSLESDSFRSRLKSDVEEAIRLTGPGFRRGVMGRLRERGYNAGICKARWESAGGLTAGSYEYIDVIDADADEEGDRRYIIDLGFAAEFAVARATEEYERVVGGLPATVVARAEEVRAAVRIVVEVARRSLKSRGLCVPPWRKRKYMLAKWLGPYRRTLNEIPANTAAEGGGEVKCRAVGFGAPRIAAVPKPTVAVEETSRSFW
ncbi:uncharacterized protein LOC110100774 [Dendrobium catenatum]|uniref:DUF506 family protein n=1 Tax=Dendrobium catenatum TaxID=906689 RepID=A0A2I0X4A2_9ASPA|nr:uncharacterized protein LOC110100774 [Dendrobium catenatum]PKU82748.1 hypothetical protein MA16_Dca015145 [Dendrobium catenatum]